jgi:penicillin-binding protein 1A
MKPKANWNEFKGLLRRIYTGPWYKRIAVWICTFFLSIIILFIAIDCNLLYLFGSTPELSEIKDPVVSEASEVYSADGKLIGRYYNEDRTPVEYKDISPILIRTLVDTEDERFYHHHGIDYQGLFSAVKDIFSGHARGASTITQQLAKNMFRVRTQYSTGLLGKIPGLRILIVKTKEWIIATKLETIFDKKEILTMYANTVDFGSNAFGIKTACKTYFNTTPSALTVEQAAVLVGMLKATTFYNPISHPENSLARRNVVLNNMVTKNDLTKQEYDSISRIPIDLSHFSVETNYDGQAQYFRETIAKYLKDWCNDNGYDLYSSGLKIYTTIDTRLQKYAEEAAKKQMQQIQQNFNSHWGKSEPWVDEHGRVIPDFIEGIAKRTSHYKTLEALYPNQPDSINYYLNQPHVVKLFDYDNGTIEAEMSTMDSIRYMVHFMHCGFIAMEAQTGAVKAWVGDIDFNSWKYDKVTALRQPGSTFKLFVYTEAMNQGLTPCDKRRDEYFSMRVYDPQKGKEVTWAPSNANGYFTYDSMTMKRAFAQSVNSVAVRLGQEMGIKRIAETAHRMGIKNKLDEPPSLALGSSDVSLLEMANAYSVIADDGKHHEPQLITKILDKNGREVYTGVTTTEQVIPYKSAFFMQQLLQGGLKERGGTSVALGGYVGNYHDVDFGGKTGTSNNHSDAWFMGISPKLVVGAWVGGEYRCIHFRTGALGQGSRTALPICGHFLSKVLQDPAFKEYHAKFGESKDKEITKDMYEQCVSYYAPRTYRKREHEGSLMSHEEIVLDENGNPIRTQSSSSSQDAAIEPEEY